MIDQIEYIARAKVIAFIQLKDKQKSTARITPTVDGENTVPFYGLAICKYDTEQGFYLFYCNENWIAITDTTHDSVEDAIDQAEFDFSGTLSDWKLK